MLFTIHNQEKALAPADRWDIALQSAAMLQESSPMGMPAPQLVNDANVEADVLLIASKTQLRLFQLIFILRITGRCDQERSLLEVWSMQTKYICNHTWLHCEKKSMHAKPMPDMIYTVNVNMKKISCMPYHIINV